MIHAAWVVFGKDLRVELRSRVMVNQVLPFAAVTLVLFAFAFDTNQQVLLKITPGLFWVATTFATLLAIQRSIAIEADNQAKDALLLYGLDPAGIFLGKLLAVVIECLALEVVLTAGVIVLFNARINSILLLTVSAILGTIGTCAVGIVYGAISSVSKVRETLLPLLILPVVSPVLLSGTKAWQDGLAQKASLSDPWVGLLLAFSLVYVALGLVSFGSVLEE